MTYAALTAWIVLLAAAALYTRRARHPDTPPLAAYLIFVTVFSAAGFFLFAILALLLQSVGLARMLDGPIGAAAFLLAVFVPAFLLARWQLRKPPRRRQP